MTKVSKKEAQAALNALRVTATTYHASDLLQALIDAMPDDPESRAERLGRVNREAYLLAAKSGMSLGEAYIASAAAVEAECNPREVTPKWLLNAYQECYYDWDKFTDRINAFVRGEDA